MNKLFLCVVLVFMVTGCDLETHERTKRFELPSDLQDCKIYYMSDGWETLKVIRCPNSSTSTHYTTRSGKSRSHVDTTVIEENE